MEYIFVFSLEYFKYIKQIVPCYSAITTVLNFLIRCFRSNLNNSHNESMKSDTEKV